MQVYWPLVNGLSINSLVSKTEPKVSEFSQVGSRLVCHVIVVQLNRNLWRQIRNAIRLLCEIRADLSEVVCDSRKKVRKGSNRYYLVSFRVQ